MNIHLPVKLLAGFALLGGIFALLSPPPVYAVSIAEQTTEYNSPLNTWKAIQELGTNLSGTAQSFTFRVSTAMPVDRQFDYTGLNSRIYDKTTNTYIISCIPDGTPTEGQLAGLAFSTTNVPAGYIDVTIDFSCRNYEFIPGHRYLILITNANRFSSGGSKMLMGSATYNGTANDYFSEGGLRYSYDNGSCNASSYRWNSQTSNSGCIVFTTPRDDLYFILSNTSPPPPPPRLPVIFIPGIGGSEMKASQDIIWSADDGHAGIYSHAYSEGEKIWVNQDKAAELGDDDYFDVLKLKADGVTSEADISLTGNLTSFGYSEIDSFFTDMGYTKGTNYFVFPYDWRKDVRSTKDSLDALIEQAKTASGQPKVNLVVHSMGGLVVRYYISDTTKAAKVNKLIELGVPHLGSPHALKALMFGTWLARDLYLFKIGIIPNEVKDIFQNLTSGFQLLPSTSYFNFYNNSDTNYPYPFRDDRDIDNNNVTNSLTYNQTKSLLTNLSYNMTTFGLGEELHTSLDPNYNQTNNVTVFEIVGASQPTLGQIHETWWITWPINLIPKTDEIFINGDGTVPLYSASLKNDSLDISGANKLYYVEQEHSNLVSSNGTAMQTVKAILNDDNSLPVEAQEQKFVLEGDQISLDDGELDLYDDQNRHCGLNSNGEIEENIPNVTCTVSGNTKHAFVKKKAAKVKVKATRKRKATTSKTTNIKKRTYRQDKISKTTIYKDLTIDENGKIEFDLDPSSDTSPTLTYYPDETQPASSTITFTSEVEGNTAFDQTPPTTSIQISGTKDISGIYTGPVTITLTGTDSEAGILKIEYSLDNGQTVQIYTGPFTISSPGITTLQIKAIDNLGNEEVPQTIIIEIAVPTTPTPAPISSSGAVSSSSSDSNNSSNPNSSTESSTISSTNVVSIEQSANTLSSPPGVLGLKFENPSHIADQITVSGILNKQNNLPAEKITNTPIAQSLGGLLVTSGTIVSIVSLGLFFTFQSWGNVFSFGKQLPNLFPRRHSSILKPFPKEM